MVKRDHRYEISMLLCFSDLPLARLGQAVRSANMRTAPMKNPVPPTIVSGFTGRHRIIWHMIYDFYDVVSGTHGISRVCPAIFALLLIPHRFNILNI